MLYIITSESLKGNKFWTRVAKNFRFGTEVKPGEYKISINGKYLTYGDYISYRFPLSNNYPKKYKIVGDTLEFIR